MSEKIKTLMSDLIDQELIELVKEEIKSRKPLEILEDLKDGLTLVGERFEKGEYFLTELIFATDIFKRANTILESALEKDDKEIKGKVVIGTVHGDFHDIGKNIIISLLRSNGYIVEDLGTDVSPETFLEAVQRSQPDILGMSGLLTASYEPMKKTVELVRKEYKNKLLIICGGAPIHEKWIKDVGADFGTNNASVGIKMINDAMKNIKTSG
ncbi:MAG: cobalamin B12-binding domain-containing protein [Candidatus Helarchaeota archaeon]